MKKLKLNLKGAKALNKAEQRQIFGGNEEEGSGKKKACARCSGHNECASGVCTTYSGDCAICSCGKGCL